MFKNKTWTFAPAKAGVLFLWGVVAVLAFSIYAPRGAAAESKGIVLTLTGPLSQATRLAMQQNGIEQPTPISYTEAATKAEVSELPAENAGLAGYTAALPALFISVDLRQCKGNVFAASYSLDMTQSGEGAAGWRNIADADRDTLLADGGVAIVRHNEILIGSGGVLTWSEAREQKIVSYAPDGITLNIAATDGASAPYAAGEFVVVPDGEQDGKIVEPIWLMKTTIDQPEQPIEDDAVSSTRTSTTRGYEHFGAIGALLLSLAGVGLGIKL